MSRSKVLLPVLVLLLPYFRMTIALGESVETNVCNLSGDDPMYCTCDDTGHDQAHVVSCVFVAQTTPGDPSWVSFENQKSITELIMTCMLNARLTFVPSAVLRRLPDLTVLVTKEFNLDTLWPYTFENMTSVRNISLENNEINKLEPYSIAFLPNLRKLSLANNKIMRIPSDGLYGLPKLKLLHLERNEIVTIDDLVFVGMPTLEELSLWDNQIDRITPKTFIGLTGLKKLHMYSNRLYRLVDGVFGGVHHLQELDLRNNLIETVSPHAFDGLNELSSLLITNNKIRTLPKHVFKGAPNLKLIDLTKNQLVTFQQTLLKPLRNSHEDNFIIFVKDNPLVCNCDILWINEQYIKNIKSFLFRKELSHLKCHLDNSTQKIVKTSPIDLACPEVSANPRAATPSADKSRKSKHKIHPFSETSTVPQTPFFTEPEVKTSTSRPPVFAKPPQEREPELSKPQHPATDQPDHSPEKKDPEESGSNEGSAPITNVLLELQCFGALYLARKIFQR